MPERQIIHIDQDTCTGCGECIIGCPEGALQIIDGKARLTSESFCDGLGACLGTCPVGAITVEHREADAYDETQVIAGIAAQGPAAVAAHLHHLREHGETELYAEAQRYLEGHPTAAAERPGPEPCGCPGARPQSLTPIAGANLPACAPSQLRQWPVQISLVPPRAPYLDGADLLIAADCTPFAYAGFHADFIKDKVVLVGCPKLDDAARHRDKLARLLADNPIASIEVVRMEVPCCYGLVRIVAEAMAEAGVDLPAVSTEITVTGERRATIPIPAATTPSLRDRHGQIGLGR